MRFGKLIIAVFTVLFLGLLLFAGRFEEPAEAEPPVLSFSVVSDAGKEPVHSWVDESGRYYVFLPGYAQLNRVCFETDAAVSFDRRVMKRGDNCGSFSLDTPYLLEHEALDPSRGHTITFVRSGNVPSLFLDTVSGTMDYLHLSKTNEESGTLRLYAEEGSLLCSSGLSSLKGRGNTSWGAGKKPYNLTLEEEADLLGMGKAGNWILLAEGLNAVCIRNKIVFDFAQAIGLPNTPECRWVDLYLNGAYAGLYLLSERNEIHPERVDISADGSFLLSMESLPNMEEQKISYINLDSTQVLRVREASVTEEAIFDTWSSLKNALCSETGVDPVSGKSWEEMIDLDSWVKKYLIEEVFINPDGGVVSQYYYMDGKDPEGKIHAGPVWDYDYAMGGEDYWMCRYPSFFVMQREYTDSGMYLPWFYELYQKPVFYERLTEEYEQVFLPQLERLLEEKLEGYCSYIRKAAKTDGIRWSHTPEEIQKEFDRIHTLLDNRKAFLTEYWLEEETYHIVKVKPGYESTGYFAVKDGEPLPSLPDYDELPWMGWYDARTDEPYDRTLPVYADGSIYVKKQEAPLPLIHYGGVCALLVGLAVLAVSEKYLRHKGKPGKRAAKKTCREQM